ncbi:MAG: zinc ABC transporter substrate-binding protein [Firmicutes bacterium]|nr:zinc ABC transporter substrate-binding protein [Bacillota bacterium]
MKKTKHLSSLSLTAIIVIIIGIIIGWSLWRQPEVEIATGSKLQVTVSMPLLRNLVEEIGGDQVEVTSIINGPSCNHHYEPTSGDLIKATRSALFIKAGMGFDPWVDHLIESSGKIEAALDASIGIVPMVIEPSGSEGQDQHADDDHHTGNPHYWGSPENVKIMAENILNGLIEVLPEKKDYFIHNYREYLAKLDKVVVELKKEAASVPDKKVASYSAAFLYLYRYFGFDNLATVETTCEQEVSPRRLAEVVAKVKANQVKVVVGETIYPKLPENLARETGAELVLLWPTTNESGDYLETLAENVKKLVAALQ